MNQLSEPVIGQSPDVLQDLTLDPNRVLPVDKEAAGQGKEHFQLGAVNLDGKAGASSPAVNPHLLDPTGLKMLAKKVTGLPKLRNTLSLHPPYLV